MLINVHVTPNSKEANVTKLDESNFEARIDERAEEGQANKRLIEILSKYLNVPKSRIRIVKGIKSRDKIVEVLSSALSLRAHFVPRGDKECGYV